MGDNEIRFLGDLQRLEIKPGDKFVLTTPGCISMDQRERIVQVWKQFAGEDAPVLILESGMRLGVISSEAE